MDTDLLTSLILEDLEEDEITEELYHTSDNIKDEEEVTENESYAAATDGEMETSLHQQLQLASDGATTTGTDEVDGNTEVSLQDKILNKGLKPRDLKKILRRNVAEVNDINPRTGLAPIHHIVVDKREHQLLLLLTLLVYSNAKIDAKAVHGKTPLALAIQANNIAMVKMLIALGACVHVADKNGTTPIQWAFEMHSKKKAGEMISSRGFETTVNLGRIDDMGSLRSAVNGMDDKLPETMAEVLRSIGVEDISNETCHNSVLQQSQDVEPDHNEIASKYKQLQDEMEAKRLEYQNNPTPQIAEQVVKAIEEMESFRNAKGSKILCLDAGGMKGLVQLAILKQIEMKSGKKIRDLFDWIVGSSTGGIIALALVYGKMNATEIERFYLRLKRDVFSRSGVLRGNSEQLEKYLQNLLQGTMDSVTHPKILISATSFRESSVQLRFFNNCFEDDYSKEEVWKVGRYTSAAPFYFPKMDGYRDGGILSDNPSEDALTVIQQFYHNRGMKLPILFVLSLGSGINPSNPNIFNIIRETLANQTAELNCQSRCVQQGIEYMRLNPPLKVEIDAGEKDNERLLDMLWTTQQYLCNTSEDGGRQSKIKKLIQLLAPKKM